MFAHEVQAIYHRKKLIYLYKYSLKYKSKQRLITVTLVNKFHRKNYTYYLQHAMIIPMAHVPTPGT